MSVAPNIDRRTRRRQETRDEIVAAAWELVRANGLAGLSMRDLGERIGMRAQSIYSYFASKNEIYDALFLEGYQAFSAHIDAATGENPSTPDLTAAPRTMAHAFVEFCVSDPTRYQLLFQRTIPDFVPSPESYGVAVEVYARMEAQLAAIGVVGQPEVDLWTATLTGITSQQLANDPGGDRWTSLVDRAVDLLLAETLTNPDPGSELP